MRKIKGILSTVTILLISLSAGAEEMKLSSLSRENLHIRQAQDQKSVLIYREGLNKIFKYMKKRNDLFPDKKLSRKRMLSLEQRRELINIWKSILDYYMALDSLDMLHRDYLFAKSDIYRSFYISYSALLAKYSFALRFLELTDNDPAFDVLFNEGTPGMGLRKNTFSSFKFRFLNVLKAGQFAAFETVRHTFKKPHDRKLISAVRSDRKVIWNMGKGTGEKMTLKNAFAVIVDFGSTAFYPVKKGVSNWMGDTKVYRFHKYLITYKQIDVMKRFLKPGDILLERREWYITNIGIPGFWTHAAIYVGTDEERDRYFGKNEISEFLKKRKANTLNEVIAKMYPSSYRKSRKKNRKGNLPRVIEAVSEGVSLTSIEYSAKCDSIAILRPVVSKKEKALAVLRAFKYHGRPYDYDFDFLTDSALVCSELIYKCYEKGSHNKGLKFPLERILGNHMMTPNLLVREFDRLSGKGKGKYELVLFIDGNEEKKKAYVSDVAAFSKSWKRPKWHVFTHK